MGAYDRGRELTMQVMGVVFQARAFERMAGRGLLNTRSYSFDSLAVTRASDVSRSPAADLFSAYSDDATRHEREHMVRSAAGPALLIDRLRRAWVAYPQGGMDHGPNGPPFILVFVPSARDRGAMEILLVSYGGYALDPEAAESLQREFEYHRVEVQLY